MMRAAKVFVVLLFAICSSLLLFFITNKNSGYSRDFVKSEIKNAGFYEAYINIMEKNTRDTLSDDKTKKDELKFVDQFYAEFNKDYLETKMNQVIDDSLLWISGESEIEPVISFIDLKEKLLKKNPEFLAMLEEMEKSKAEMAVEEENMEIDSNEANNLVKFLEADPVIKLKSSLAPIKQAYKIYQISFYIFIVIALLLLGLLLLLSKSKSNKFKWLTAAFGVGFLVNLVVFGAVMLLQKSDPLPRIFAAILGLDLRSNEFGFKTVELAHNLSAPWFTSFYKVQIIGIIILLALTITFLVLAMRSGVTPTPPVKKRK